MCAGELPHTHRKQVPSNRNKYKNKNQGNMSLFAGINLIYKTFFASSSLDVLYL